MSIKHDGILLGALAMFVIYAITGRFFVSLFQGKHEPVLPDYFNNE
jgi:hypothetical protein